MAGLLVGKAVLSLCERTEDFVVPLTITGFFSQVLSRLKVRPIFLFEEVGTGVLVCPRLDTRQFPPGRYKASTCRDSPSRDEYFIERQTCEPCQRKEINHPNVGKKGNLKKRPHQLSEDCADNVKLRSLSCKSKLKNLLLCT